MSERDHQPSNGSAKSYEPPYREHRIRGSLQRCVADRTDAEQVQRLAASAYHERRGIYFSEADLARMGWDTRALIEAQARRIYGPRRQAGEG